MPDSPENTPPAKQETPNPPAAAAPAVDVQAEIKQALAARDLQHADELKQATGFNSVKELNDARLAEQGKTQELLDSRSAELAAVTKRFQDAQIKTALLSAATDSVDADVVVSLLVNQCQCDENGNVTVNGQQPGDAVKALLESKPFLAKPMGGAGSGAPQNAGTREVNPWMKEHFNLTDQIRINKTNPSLAAQLKAAAGQ